MYAPETRLRARLTNIMRRSSVPRPEADSTDGDRDTPHRRAAVHEVARLGWLYGTLNQLVPLVRLAALIAFVRSPSRLLWPVVCFVASSLSLRACSQLARRLVPAQEAGSALLTAAAEAAEEGERVSSSVMRSRLLVTNLVQLIGHALLLGVGGLDLPASALDPGLPDHGRAAAQGGGAALAVFALWLAAQRVFGAQRRTDLKMAGSPVKDGMPSSTEDELVLLMPLPQRLAFVATRCAQVLLETLADLTLLFVFLVNAMSDEPALALYGPLPQQPYEPRTALVVALAALCYGSQHLRFKGEWLLGLGMGAVLVALGRYNGDLRASYVAAALFAILRYLNRTRDIRSVHGA